MTATDTIETGLDSKTLKQVKNDSPKELMYNICLIQGDTYNLLGTGGRESKDSKNTCLVVGEYATSTTL